MKRLRPAENKWQPDSTLPLINIVLLLVLTFMIAGTFASPLPPDFSPLQAAEGQKIDQKQTSLSVSVDQTGIATLAGNTLPIESAKATFASAAGTGTGVEIRADARAPANTVIRLMAVAEEAGVNSVQLITLAKPE